MLSTRFEADRHGDPTLGLLIELALRDPSEAMLTRAHTLLEGPLDWRRLSALARKHRLLPMLVHNLKRIDAQPPSDWWKQTRDAARVSGTRATLLAGELILLQRELRTVGIPSIAVKGPALGVLAHGTPVLRTMADIDLVVRDADFESTSLTLVARGYRQCSQEDHDVRTFTHPERPIHIEVHRRLDKRYLPLFPLDESVWSSPDRVDLMGAQVDVLPIRLHASFLIYHGSRHGWSRLGWLSVLVDFLGRQCERLDGETLVDDAERNGLGAMVRLTDTLAREAWPEADSHLPVPSQPPRSVTRIARTVRSGWTGEEPSRESRTPARKRYAHLLRRVHHTISLADRPTDRAWTVIRVARKAIATILPPRGTPGE